MWKSLPLDGAVHMETIDEFGRKTISLEEAGLFLTVPAGAIPPGLSVRVAMYHITSSPLELPPGLKLVSQVAVIAVNPEAQLLKPMKVSLSCQLEGVQGTSSSELTFVKACHIRRPSEVIGSSKRAPILVPFPGGEFKRGPAVSGVIFMSSLNVVAIAIAQRIRHHGAAHRGRCCSGGINPYI